MLLLLFVTAIFYSVLVSTMLSRSLVRLSLCGNLNSRCYCVINVPDPKDGEKFQKFPTPYLSKTIDFKLRIRCQGIVSVVKVAAKEENC